MEYKEIISNYLYQELRRRNMYVDISGHISKLRNDGKLNNSVEGVAALYTYCMQINNEFFDYEKEKLLCDPANGSVLDHVLFLYKSISQLSVERELYSEVIFVDESRVVPKSITVDNALNGASTGDLYFFESYDMRDLRKGFYCNGMLKFVTYALFNLLVENGMLEEARKVASEINVLAKIERCYTQFGHDAISRLIDLDISGDLSELIDKNKLRDSIKDSYLLEECFELISSSKNKLYVEPIERLLVNYYRTLESAEKQEYILGLLSIFPKNKYYKALIDESINKGLISKINELFVECQEKDVDLENMAKQMENTISPERLKWNVDNLPSLYRNINFSNLDKKTMTFIGTANYVYECLNNSEKSLADYSPAVIGWSKAVENEYRNKITKPIKEAGRYIKNDLWSMGIDLDKIDMLGSAFYLNKNIRYIYDNIYKYCYSVDLRTLSSLLTLISEYNRNYRRDSAHPEEVNQIKASECKKKVLSIKQILELLSRIK